MYVCLCVRMPTSYTAFTTRSKNHPSVCTGQEDLSQPHCAAPFTLTLFLPHFLLPKLTIIKQGLGKSQKTRRDLFWCHLFLTLCVDGMTARDFPGQSTSLLPDQSEQVRTDQLELVLSHMDPMVHSSCAVGLDAVLGELVDSPVWCSRVLEYGIYRDDLAYPKGQFHPENWLHSCLFL